MTKFSPDRRIMETISPNPSPSRMRTAGQTAASKPENGTAEEAPTPLEDRAAAGIATREAGYHDLILAISAADESALAMLYDQTKSLVYGLSLRLLANPAD